MTFAAWPFVLGVGAGLGLVLAGAIGLTQVTLNPWEVLITGIVTTVGFLLTLENKIARV